MISRTRAYALRAMIEKASISLSDEDALQAIELYPAWAEGVAYAVDDRIRYNGVLYRVVQAHTSQADWTPDITPALFTVVSLEEVPEWVQPTGAQDAYNTGDKVTYNGSHWISTVDANVWAPGVYGWDQL